MQVEKKDCFRFAGMFAVGILLVGGSEFWFGGQQKATQAEMTQIELALGESEGSESLDTLHDQVGLLRTAIKREAKVLPLGPDTGGLHVVLSQAMESVSVAGEGIVFGDTVVGKGWGAVPVDINFDGTFQDADAVMRFIERSSRMVRLENLLVESDPRRAGTQRVKLSLLAYFVPTKEDADG